MREKPIFSPFILFFLNVDHTQECLGLALCSVFIVTYVVLGIKLEVNYM